MTALLLSKKNHTVSLLILISLLVAICLISMLIGPSGLTLPVREEIFSFRFQRILLSIIAGSSLAASGTSLQAIFRNPLADPHIFGISGGAALGAAIVIAFFQERIFLPGTGAIIGGLIAFILLFLLALRSPSYLLSNFLLVGILINALSSALITVLKTILPMGKTQSLLFWLVGHIVVVDVASFYAILPLWIIGMAGLLMVRGELEILSFGLEEGKILGIDAEKVIKIAVVANCLLIGNVVAFAGMIGFLGLVMPHLVRMVVNANLFIVLPYAAIGGAILLVIFDALSRLSFLFFSTEIPVGALSALILTPVLFWLLVRKNYVTSRD